MLSEFSCKDLTTTRQLAISAQRKPTRYFYQHNKSPNIFAHGGPRSILNAAVTATQPTPAQRLRKMHDQLAAAYGPQHWWPADTPFEVILGAYLTQNTAWKAVERSLANLRSAGAHTVDGLRALPLAELQRLIQPSGFHTRKAPALKAFVALLDDKYDSSLQALAAAPTPLLRRRLLALPGVGPETADAILLYALGHSVPVADEYLRRIVERHQLLSPAPTRNRKGYDSLIELTRHAFAVDRKKDRAQFFNDFHALTIAVGKAHCGKTAHCAGCPLATDLDLL
jgi:endonuclease-3 related protein